MWDTQACSTSVVNVVSRVTCWLGTPDFVVSCIWWITFGKQKIAFYITNDVNKAIEMKDSGDVNDSLSLVINTCNRYTCSVFQHKMFVSWCFEPSQPLGVTSELNTISNQSLSYSAHKPLISTESQVDNLKLSLTSVSNTHIDDIIWQFNDTYHVNNDNPSSITWIFYIST